MRLFTAWLGVFSAALPACVSVGRDTAAAADRTASGASTRLAVDIRAPADGDDDGTLAPGVRELLAAGLDEDAAVKIALLNNRTVRAAFAQLGVASAELDQARLLANPVFSASAKFFDSGTEFELGLTQSFLDVFRAPLRRRIAEAELEVASLRVERELVDLVFDVRRALLDVRASQQLVRSRQAELAAAEASRALTLDLHAAGNVTELELARDDELLSAARLALTDAEADAAEMREPLDVLLGLSGDALAWEVRGDLPADVRTEVDLASLEARAQGASFDLALLSARARAAARRAGLAQWETTFPLERAGLVAQKDADSSEWALGPTVELVVPLFDTGAARELIGAAELRGLVAEHHAAVVETRSAARRLGARYVRLAVRGEYLRDVHLPIHDQLVRATLRNFNAMQVGAFDVLATRRRELAAERDHVVTLRETWRARFDLEQLLAGSLVRERVAMAPRFGAAGESDAERRGH